MESRMLEACRWCTLALLCVAMDVLVGLSELLHDRFVPDLQKNVPDNNVYAQ